MKNYIQKGETVPLTASEDVAGGAFVAAGVLVGVAQHSAAAGETVETLLEGVVEAPKTSAEAWAVGDALYYDPTGKTATKTAATGTILIGVALEAAANPSDTGIMRLNGSFPAAAVAAES